MVKVTCISDTHLEHKRLTKKLVNHSSSPSVFIHAGDFTNFGNIEKIEEVFYWVSDLPYDHLLMICGNHEVKVSENDAMLKPLAASYGIQLIHNEVVEIEGFKFYGEPRSREFFNWGWSYNPGQEAEEVWAKLPEDIDVLVTHGPPHGCCDFIPTIDLHTLKPVGHQGCISLRRAIEEKKPRYVVCGHIHEGYGTSLINETTVINAAIMNKNYVPVNDPVTFELRKRDE